MTSNFQQVKQSLLNLLVEYKDYLIYPNDRLDVLKSVGVDTFVSFAKIYNSTLLKIRKLYSSLHKLEKFTFLYNSQCAWMFSVTNTIGKLNIYKEAMIKETQNQNFFTQILYNQAGLKTLPLALFMNIKKQNNEYAFIDPKNKNTTIMTHERVCNLLPNPFIIKNNTLFNDCSFQGLDDSDKFA